MDAAWKVATSGIEATVFEFIQQKLGDYIHFTREQLNVSGWAGEGMLENVSIRADALRSLSLPLRVRSGRIARVRVRIPWHALRSEPMAIFIEDLVLEVMAAPRAQGEQAKLPDEPTALLIPNDSSDASGASTASYFSKVVGLIM